MTEPRPPSPQVQTPQQREPSPVRTGGSGSANPFDYPSPARRVLDEPQVTVNGLRILYDELLAHIDRCYSMLGDETLDALLQRCRTDLQRVLEGRISELADAVERIRALVGRVEMRVELLEKIPSRRETAPSFSTHRFAGSEAHPSHPAPVERIMVRPPNIPPTPELPPSRGRAEVEPRINPAVFEAQSLADRKTPWNLGPREPGLEILSTLLPDFRDVLDYRAYRLADTSREDNQHTLYPNGAAKVVTQIRSLMPRLENFTGQNPISLLRFLRDIRQAMDGVRLSEGAAIRTVSWFLEGDALQTYSSRVFTGVRQSYDAIVTWPRLVNSLLERYLPDDVLGEAYSKVTTATQGESETESDFLTRVERYASECCGVFDDFIVVNHFLRGLRPTIRPLVTQRVHDLPVERRTNLNNVRRIAQAEGDAYRARLREPRLTQGRPNAQGVTRSRIKAPVALIDEEFEYTAPPAQEDHTVLLIDPNANAVPPVMPIAGGEGIVDDTVDATVQDRIERILPRRIPPLSQRQLAMAKSIIPGNGAPYVCWLCREDGHTLYTCEWLTKDQRMFAAYKNYEYQIETRPHMRNLMRQKAQEFIDDTEARVGTHSNVGRGNHTAQRVPWKSKSILRRSDNRMGRAAPARMTRFQDREAGTSQPLQDAIMAVRNELGPEAAAVVESLALPTSQVELEDTQHVRAIGESGIANSGSDTVQGKE